MKNRPASASARPGRDARLKAALKANMARRKAQAKARAEGRAGVGDEPATPGRAPGEDSDNNSGNA